MLFYKSSLLTGVEASAAQNLPVTKTCSQCGAVLPSSVRACSFCDSSFSVGPSIWEDPSDISAKINLAVNAEDPGSAGIDRSKRRPVFSHHMGQDPGWRGELSQRLEAYRTRRRRLAPNEAQSQFAFDDHSGKTPPHISVAVAEPPASAKDERKSLPGLHPVASIDDRRLAALIDLCCLLFAYGGFLMLFGSLGGQFTLSKLNAAVYATTFAIVYLQYFTLFTTFGGTTPGMMMRGLQVVSFSGEPPTPRQMLLRSVGYILSAGTFFLGFLWAMWDEDELTWHDRLSRTHLSPVQTLTDLESSSVAHSR